jgi:hypothetical protein
MWKVDGIALSSGLRKNWDRRSCSSKCYWQRKADVTVKRLRQHQRVLQDIDQSPRASRGSKFYY